MNSSRSKVLLLGPARSAVSGVSTHLNQLFASNLAQSFSLSQFQVGSEGRSEGRMGTLLRMLISPFQLTLRLLRTRPDVVHINTSFEPKGYWRDLVYLVIAKLLRLKVVYQVHGGAQPQEFFAGNQVLTGLLRRVLSCPDVIVLLSSAEMTAYRQFAPRARLELIANAIAVPDENLNLARYGGEQPLQVVYVGRLADNKGVMEIIEAARQLRDRGIEMHFSFAGAGPAQDKLRAIVQLANLNDRAKLLGPVFGPRKQQLWDQSHIFAFPTYHREGLPYALLEGMAAGAVPVISPVGGIPDVVQDEVHGLFVPSRNPSALADALERLHRDRALLLQMARAGRKRIEEHYSLSRLAAEFQQLYAGIGSAGT
jgi:glycosyltransferase involved in cell wall biosynthesis